MFWKERKGSSDPAPPVKKQRIDEHYECNICGASFENVQELKDYFSTHQEENNEDEEEYPDEDPLMEKALGNAVKWHMKRKGARWLRFPFHNHWEIILLCTI